MATTTTTEFFVGGYRAEREYFIAVDIMAKRHGYKSRARMIEAAIELLANHHGETLPPPRLNHQPETT